MKRNVQTVADLKNKIATAAANRTSKAVYPGSLMGDIEDVYDNDLSGDPSDEDDVSGPIVLNIGDVSDYVGAPKTKTVADLAASKMRNRKAPFSPKKPKPITTGAQMLSASIIPVFWGTNVDVIQFGVEKGIAGDVLKYNLDLHRSATPATSILTSAAGAGAGNNKAITIAPASLPAGFTSYTIPIVFVTISASILNARAGNRYNFYVEALSNYGATGNSEVWVLQRKDANKPMMFGFIPFVRVKDDVKPIVGMIGGPDAQEFTVNVANAGTDETIQVVVPGLDSQELKQFLSSWKISN